jgi:hypothetical protein
MELTINSRLTLTSMRSGIDSAAVLNQLEIRSGAESFDSATLPSQPPHRDFWRSMSLKGREAGQKSRLSRRRRQGRTFVIFRWLVESSDLSDKLKRGCLNLFRRYRSSKLKSVLMFLHIQYHLELFYLTILS